MILYVSVCVCYERNISIYKLITLLYYFSHQNRTNKLIHIVVHTLSHIDSMNLESYLLLVYDNLNLLAK